MSNPQYPGGPYPGGQYQPPGAPPAAGATAVAGPGGTPWPAPAGTAGYCARCGTPFAAGSGAFCRKCGNRVRVQPAVATAYSYPTVPGAWVPSAQHRLSHQRMVLAAVGALVLLVVVISAVAVSAKPTTTFCHFSCGPAVGPRLAGHSVYSSSLLGYRVEYESPPFSVAQQGNVGAVLQANFGVFVVKGQSGTDVAGLMKAVLGGLSTSEFQNLQQVSASVPGAEIGYVPGQGQVYTAQFVPPSGGQSSTFVIVVIGATNGTLSLAAMAVAPQDLSSAGQLPFGVTAGPLFDFEVSNTIWPGQS